MRKLAVAVALAALCLPSAAFGRIVSNTIERTGKVAGGGERAKVTALVACDRVQEAKVWVTLTQGPRQDEERAWGKGAKRVGCETGQAGFGVRVKARQQTSFDAGKATACALALTDDDAIQWCKQVRLRA